MLLFNVVTRVLLSFIVRISIHPMLLFNLTLFSSTLNIVSFQYIPCYYSTDVLESSKRNLFLFQYIPCYYSTEKNYFKKEWRTNFNTSYVIIQLYSDNGYPINVPHFNTSYVIIQPTKNRHSCILLIYINHDLKPFLSYFTNHSIENQLFVRNHVFTPFDRLFQKITW